MAQLSYEEFEKFNSKAENTQSQKTNIRYFSLRDDGDSAIVRFNIHSLADITVQSVHNIELNVGEKKIYATVGCLRESFNDPQEKCPLCASGNKMSFKIFVPLISYNEDENGNIVTEAGVWQQGTRIRQILKSFIDDYGDLSNMLFKITRNGKKGNVNTTYTILPANPNIYKDSIYVKDFSQFDNNPNYIEKFVHNRTFEDLTTYVKTGTMPNPYVKEETVENKVQPVNNVQVNNNVQNNIASQGPLRGTFDNKSANTSNSPTPVRRYSY